MAESQTKRKTIRVGIALVVVACMLGAAFFVLKILITGDAGKRKRVVQRVTLIKPPPPPKPKEKPPEPEVRKKEELPQPEQEELPSEDIDDSMDDEAPPGEDLGLDAEGSGAGDAFGLKGNKGGGPLSAAQAAGICSNAMPGIPVSSRRRSGKRSINPWMPGMMCPAGSTG